MNKKYILTSVGIVFMSLIVFSLYIIFNQTSQRTGVDFRVIPNNAQISIGDTSNKPGFIKKPPGIYTAVVSKEGYRSASIKVTVTADKSPVHYTVLTPQSEEAKKEAFIDKDKIIELEAAAGAQAESKGEDLQNRYPLAKKLPYKSLLFRIDYRMTGDKKDLLAVQITANSPLERSYAIKQIKNWGFEPSEYTIEFPSLDNPFKKGAR